MIRHTGGLARPLFPPGRALSPGDRERLLRRHDPQLLPGVVDDPHLADPDPFVHLRAVFPTRASVESDINLQLTRGSAPVPGSVARGAPCPAPPSRGALCAPFHGNQAAGSSRRAGANCRLYFSERSLDEPRVRCAP